RRRHRPELHGAEPGDAPQRTRDPAHQMAADRNWRGLALTRHAARKARRRPSHCPRPRTLAPPPELRAAFSPHPMKLSKLVLWSAALGAGLVVAGCLACRSESFRAPPLPLGASGFLT